MPGSAAPAMSATSSSRFWHEDFHERARSYACEGVDSFRKTCFVRRLTPAATVQGPDAFQREMEPLHEPTASPLPGGEPATVLCKRLPSWEGYGGGFMVPMRAPGEWRLSMNLKVPGLILNGFYTSGSWHRFASNRWRLSLSLNRQVLDCASPLALSTHRAGRRAAEDCRTPRRCRADVCSRGSW